MNQLKISPHNMNRLLWNQSPPKLGGDPFKSNPELFKTESNFKKKLAGLRESHGSIKAEYQIQRGLLTTKYQNDFNMKLLHQTLNESSRVRLSKPKMKRKINPVSNSYAPNGSFMVPPMNAADNEEQFPLSQSASISIPINASYSGHQRTLTDLRQTQTIQHAPKKQQLLNPQKVSRNSFHKFNATSSNSFYSNSM